MMYGGIGSESSDLKGYLPRVGRRGTMARFSGRVPTMSISAAPGVALRADQRSARHRTLGPWRRAVLAPPVGSVRRRPHLPGGLPGLPATRLVGTPGRLSLSRLPRLPFPPGASERRAAHDVREGR